MKLEDLNNYPEYPDKEIVKQFCILVLDEAENKTAKETLSNLRYLGDKQWHTYELPSDELRARIKAWLINSGAVDSDENLVDALVISFCFALDKAFYKMLLDRLSGETKWQFTQDFENSLQDDMDPWWSLKKLKNS
jgi:hypothetical protein